MQVIFLHGPAVVGKYTVARELSELTGLPLFHNHLTVDLVRSLFDFGTEPFRTLRASIWVDVFRTAAAAGRSFIFTFNPESTVARTLIDEMVEAVEAQGGRVRFVELECSEETVLARLDSPSRHEFRKLTDVSVYREFAAAGGFDFPPLPAAECTVDTDRFDPHSAARHIAETLGIDEPA